MSSRNNSNLFGPTSALSELTPVMLPAGLLRLGTRPVFTGSAPVSKTIGITDVAALAASAAARLPGAAITATLRSTSSAARAGRRPLWPCAHRYSITTFRPSSKPTELRPSWNARSRDSNNLGVSLPRYPTTGETVCWARPTRGQRAAAPLRTLRNARRFKLSPSVWDRIA